MYFKKQNILFFFIFIFFIFNILDANSNNFNKKNKIKEYIKTGEYLHPGDYIVSKNKKFFAIFQTDGNFVVYKGSGPGDASGAIWSIGKFSNDKHKFIVQQFDGNLVAYHNKGKPYWAHNKTFSGSHQYFTIMQNGGNLVTYSGTPEKTGNPIWASGIVLNTVNFGDVEAVPYRSLFYKAYYKFISKKSKLIMNVKNSGKNNGDNIQLGKYNNKDEQKWLIKYAYDGYYRAHPISNQSIKTG